MIENEKVRIWVNRVFAFLIGGVLVFLVLNLSTVSSIKKQNEELQKELDESQYGARRLLDNAKASFEGKDYAKAKEALDALFEKQPGSIEAVEGKSMYTDVLDKIEEEQTEQKDMDRKWEAAVAAIREEWQKERAAQLRLQLEQEMGDKLEKEWQRAKDEVRREWEGR